MHLHVHSSSIYDRQVTMQPKCPQTDEWIKKMCPQTDEWIKKMCPQTDEWIKKMWHCYSAMKNNEIKPLADPRWT